ncbi:hypothetical protein PINS_up013080 [Pythium insidiosum]|nr:hypothetical protein PINS_up013080 [Pythium insidiosum]
MPITTLIGFLAQPRVQYAMARDGLLPAVFAHVDDTGNLFRGTLLCGVAVILIATFVPFQVLWSFISLGILVAFNLTNASLLLVRAARLRDGANGETRERTHSLLIVVFLVTSFLAAFPLAEERSSRRRRACSTRRSPRTTWSTWVPWSPAPARCWRSLPCARSSTSKSRLRCRRRVAPRVASRTSARAR